MLAACLAAGPAAAQGPARVLVMPFETGHDPREWWLGEGAAVAMADALRAIGVDVIARDERLHAFARLQVPPVASLSHGTVIRVGQLVGAQSVIIGSVSLDGTRVVVKARSLRLDTGRMQAEVQEQGSLEHLFDTFSRAAGRLAPLNVKPPSGPRPAPPSPQAFEQFMKGLLADTPGAQAALFEKALAVDPGYDRAWLALWRVRSDAGEHEKALAAALAVKESSPSATVAKFDAALSEIALRRWDDAFNRLRGVAEAANASEALNNLGVIQVRRGSTPATGKATYWFTKATQADPANATYFFNLGYAYWLDQDVAAAIYWLREAVRRAPADADAHHVLGWALQVSGSATEAARELELARRLSATYETSDRKSGVPRGLERLDVVPNGPEMARADVALGQAEQRDYRELAAFHLERGRRFFGNGSDGEAIAELNRALYLSPYLAEAHLLLGRVYLRGGRTAEAVDALKIAVWSEESAATHLALAEAYIKARQPDAARREAERALALDPASSPAREVLRQLAAQ